MTSLGDQLRAELAALKTTSTNISGLSQLYDFARQCQTFLLKCVQSMSDLPANRDIFMIKDILNIIDDVLRLYNETIEKISAIKNSTGQA